jgi:hypothetical protein
LNLTPIEITNIGLYEPAEDAAKTAMEGWGRDRSTGGKREQVSVII